MQHYYKGFLIANERLIYVYLHTDKTQEQEDTCGR